MGIKTKFNPMGGMPSDSSNLFKWRYSTAPNGQITLYEYLSIYSTTKPLYVPVVKGKTIINNYTSGSTPATSNAPFYNNPDVTSVDFQNVPFVNNDMSNAFYNCKNLKSIARINKSVINMSSTFYFCSNFNQGIEIPSGVTNMFRTFSGCNSFNKEIQIPIGVTNMESTFSSCYNFNQEVQIPSSVSNLSFTFSGCYNLSRNIQIPGSVTDMSRAFSYCYNMGSSGDKFVNIYTTSLTNGTLNEAFSYTSYYNTSNQLTVMYPRLYINGAVTPTHRAMTNAGYSPGTAAGNISANASDYRNLRFYDPVAWQGYDGWTGNGTHWQLTSWGNIGLGAGQEVIQVPTSITSYNTFPTVIVNTCFYSMTTDTGLREIDCNHIPVYPAAQSDHGMFQNVYYVNSVYNFNCQNTTQLYAIVYNSRNLNSFSTGIPRVGTFFLDMPSAITNVQAMCGHTKQFSDYYLLSNSMGSSGTELKMYSSFNGCNARDYNIYLTHTNWVNGTNWTRNWSTSNRKNVYAYYTYSNGTPTNLYNVFNSSSNWKGTVGGDPSVSPHYNSTFNGYFYNMSLHYCPTNNPSWWCCPVNGALKYTGVGYKSDTVSSFTFPSALNVRQFPDKYINDVPVNTQDMSNMFNGFFKINAYFLIPSDATDMSYTFRNCLNFNQEIHIPNNVTNMYYTFLNCISLNYPIVNYPTYGIWLTGGNIAISDSVINMKGAFYGCTNLNQTIKLPKNVTDMSYTFYDCYNLNQSIQIPSTVTDMSHTFESCSSFNQDIQIPSSVTNMVNAFTSATSLSGRINILSENVINAAHCFSHTSEAKDVYIPFNYSNGIKTQTFNSFVSAGYVYANGVSRDREGVTIYDLNG